MSVACARPIPPWWMSTLVAVTFWSPAWVTLIVSPLTDLGGSTRTGTFDPSPNDVEDTAPPASDAAEGFGEAVLGLLDFAEAVPVASALELVRARGVTTFGLSGLAVRAASAAASAA